MNTKEALLNTLKDLRAAVPALASKEMAGSFDPTGGICWNAMQPWVDASSCTQEEYEEMDLLLCDAMMTWPEAYQTVTGDVCLSYPVDGADEFLHGSQTLGTLWTNPRRIQLLDYIIEELSK